jgi:hypothetical protein
LHSEELHNLYSFPNIIGQINSRKIMWACMYVYTILGGKPKIKRPFRRPRCRWEYGIRMDLKETGWRGECGFSWLRIGTSGGLLWTFGFHKKQCIFLLA